MSPRRAVDANLAIDGQSLAVSNGRVFFRSSEREMAARTTTRASVTAGGLGPNNDSTVSATLVRRPVRDLLQCRGPTFPMRTTLPPCQLQQRLPPRPGRQHARAARSRRRRRTAEVHLLRMAARRARRCRGTGGSSSSNPTIGTSRTRCSTRQPRATSTSTCVIAASQTASPVGGGCVPSTVRVSVAADGSHCASPSVGFSSSPAVSDDGRFIAFASSCTNLVPGDTNGDDGRLRPRHLPLERRRRPALHGDDRAR